MNCVDFYSKVTVSRQVQIRKQWLKEDGIIDNNLDCRQECRKKQNTNGQKEGEKNENLYIYT